MQSPWDSTAYGSHPSDMDELAGERSTSAPPPETGFLFGSSEGLRTPTVERSILGDGNANGEDKWGSPFSNRNIGASPMSTLFPNSNSTHCNYEGSSSGFPSSLSTPIGKGGLTYSSSVGHDMKHQGSLGNFDEQVFGQGLRRSQSETRTLESRFSQPPSPGIHNREKGLSASYHGEADDSASSSVIQSLGLGNEDGRPTRQTSKTLMELIQEDTDGDNGFGPFSHMGNTYTQRSNDAAFPQFPRNYDMYGDWMGGSGNADLSSSFERLNMNQRGVFGDRGQGLAGNHMDDANSRNNHSAYGQVAQQAPRQGFSSPNRSMQPAQQGQPHVQNQAQAVYVNVPSHHYGYNQVQYQTHSQQHQMVHPGAQEPYVAVLPISGANPGGTFAYFPPDSQPGVPQTYAIVNTQGNVPVAMPRAKSDSQHKQGTAGGRGKEKGGRGRRGGGSRRNGDQKHQSSAVGSPLLEEFKSKKNREWTVLDIEGHVVEFCQDQNGSRFMQQRLEIGDPKEKEVVMAEVLPEVGRLRNDVFGNYVVQKLLDFGTQKMREDLRDTLKGEMLKLSLHSYGCRVVQKALETLDDKDIPGLLTEFHGHVLKCIHDQHGNHVIQKCVEVMSAKAKKARAGGNDVMADYFNGQIDFIVDDVLNNVQSLACHAYGCRVLQRLLEHSPEPKKSMALDEISSCHKTLLDDQYGNYVIQHVLQFGRSSDRDSILDIVVSNGLLILSRQKFASNVVEKLLQYGNHEQRKRIVREMLKVRKGSDIEESTFLFDRDSYLQQLADDGSSGAQGTSVVLLMVRDAYANYVVQTTLDVIAEGEEKRLLMEELNAHSAELKNYTFAKHIVAKLSA
eukprot:Nitzschia sp. Nitz4//scaffold121_size67750//10287//13196//NITZ4_006062-RA/size67750-augustus-gene-0.120-mRNA-1//1//CDS//3329534333//4413//frame0